ncbi:cysteine proteinase [Rozella allomycis CSF55]|uniref:Ubiquitin carboxyl-terminal hydrolase n=1 Tax=Rozella allomycis (strain CSF55) TaxID=988480 RepID=A0A075B2K7_ROZAC|nr:Peptidase C19, ubiquitin carboxyl-terminal hydrolase 2 domain-containing protein [Rozella allomycis CSF55]RKP21786.1 cysteine proteinase [Rozella allomycis CSF55]|eukprot:EPZ35181.1 Peptidase C19, ubiquitin carboxyl-terminal hydrolase 2 domain-containing protein [Rozella allomycis CSF55]
MEITFGSIPLEELSQMERSSSLTFSGICNTKSLTTDEKPEISAPKIKSWANLFNADKTDKVVILQEKESIRRKQRILPRGLINGGNLCYMNSILQPLVFNEAFFEMIKTLSLQISSSSITILFDAILSFLNEFRIDDTRNDDSEFGNPFLPEYVYDALRTVKRLNSLISEQEDAQEFLGFLLDELNEEIHRSSQRNNREEEETSGDMWNVVGKRNKVVKARHTEINKSLVTQLFCGKYRSDITDKKSNKKTITVEPFQFLQLDIQKARSLKDALDELVRPEVITSGNKSFIKQMRLEQLPKILIIHLKRFIYHPTLGVTKNFDFVAYPETLQFDAKHLSLNQLNLPKYKLTSVVYHHGWSTNGGHYTCDVLWKEFNRWLHFDDETILPTDIDNVLKEKQDRNVYILFYEALD